MDSFSKKKAKSIIATYPHVHNMREAWDFRFVLTEYGPQFWLSKFGSHDWFKFSAYRNTLRDNMEVYIHVPNEYVRQCSDDNGQSYVCVIEYGTYLYDRCVDVYNGLHDGNSELAFDPNYESDLLTLYLVGLSKFVLETFPVLVHKLLLLETDATSHSQLGGKHDA